MSEIKTTNNQIILQGMDGKEQVYNILFLVESKEFKISIAFSLSLPSLIRVSITASQGYTVFLGLSAIYLVANSSFALAALAL